MCLRRHEIGLSSDGDLRFQSHEIASCGSIEQPLLGRGVPRVAVGD